MQSRVFGIDPGISGGVACLDPSDPFNPASSIACKLPTKPHPDAIGNRKVIDPVELRNFTERNIQKLSAITAFAGIERVASMPTDGHVGAFAFGRAVGSIETTLTLSNIYIIYSNPAAWKSSFRLSSDKSLSTQMAARLWPHLASIASNHNVAEALLIALYTAKQHFKAQQSDAPAPPASTPAFLE
jgi:hypothetical protein